MEWYDIRKRSEKLRPVSIVIGGRGIGKTYSALSFLLETGKKFLYLRNTDKQMSLCASAFGNPFKKVASDQERDITMKAAGEIYVVKEVDDVIGYGAALSTFENLRGVDLSDVEYVLFDEFIENRTLSFKQGSAFMNLYETINRNRELEGKPAVKVYLLGNANKLSNPYYTGWHFMKTAIKMIRGDQMVWRSSDGSRLMILLLHSPISEKKRSTTLYRNSNGDFLKMALDNAFRTDETVIKSEPLIEYGHMVSVGEIGIYKHKSERRFYVSSKTQEPYYHDYGIELKLFQQDFAMLRIYYMVSKTMIFESYENEIIFRELFNLNK